VTDAPDLVDLLFGSALSIAEIAAELDVTEYELRRQIRRRNLGWVRGRSISRGQDALVAVMRQLLPGEAVLTEVAIGERLRLDACCPRYRLAAEYHGAQHFRYCEHFHRDMAGFRASQARDRRKEEICRQKGVALVVFRAEDDLSEQRVFDRLLAALEAMPPLASVAEPVDRSVRDRQREYRRAAYQRYKQERPIL
jgi:hypothetical protein